MDTAELWEDKWNRSSASHDSTDIKDEYKITDIRTFAVTCALCVIAIVIFVFAFFCMANRCKNSGNNHRRRNGSETCELYQNSATIRKRLAGDSLETLVNRPLPQPPEETRQSTGEPAVPENDYLLPIPVNSLWLQSREEIENLPPAPPVFPRQLEILPLGGEGAYTIVINDDEAPLLPPSPMHEVTPDQQLCEPSEESGYMVPKSPAHTSLQQNVTETDHSSEPRKMRHKGNEYQMIARAVVTSHEAQKQCPNKSKRRSLSESATVQSTTQNETEKSNDTKGQIYRSTCQLYLSPPTQHRSPQASTSKATVVVYINTNT